MSSSPRSASPCEAVIVHVDPAKAEQTAAEQDALEPRTLQPGWAAEAASDGQPAKDLPRHGQLRDVRRWHGGPLRLPRQQQAEFVQQFNQLYRTLGMRLEVCEAAEDSENVNVQP